MDSLYGLFITRHEMNVAKNHPPRLHIDLCNVELLSLPSRPPGTRKTEAVI
jgi:hypothetical protein